MKILREYTLEALRRNKRTSFAVMTAILLMTALMSCLCGFVYTNWTDSVRLTKLEEGDWHGELFDTTYGRELEFIENYASVSSVMIKGQWEVAKLGEEGRRNYLITRGADKNYWDSMPEKEIVIEGRPPLASGELALSKQYFENHPQLKLGDTLTLPVGQRIYQGRVCTEVEGFHQSETFRQTGTKTYTIVGKLDATTPSVVPAYTGIGYLDRREIASDDELTVYLRFKNMRDTYRELPKLAQALGWEKDEYGKYHLKYNTGLLTKYAILSPDQQSVLSQISAWAVPLMFTVIALLVTSLFVLVIHNAFALSANERLTQLGTLSGVGATPRQIRASLVFEAFLLAAIPLPIGIFLGWLLNQGLFTIINQHNDIGRELNIIPTFGLPALLPSVVLSLLTVWLSAWIPARKVGKLMPIDAIRQGGQTPVKDRHREGFLCRRLGIVGELAGNALHSRKKSYRTATVSLSLSFLLFTGFLYILSAQKAAADVYSYDYEDIRHITIGIEDGRRPDPDALKEMQNTIGVSGAKFYNTLSCATLVGENQASEDINRYFDGFEGIVARKKYSLAEKSGKFRVFTQLVGLDENSFRQYCESQNIDPEPYFTHQGLAVFYNRTEDPDESTRRKSVYRDLLKLEKGQELLFTEKAYDEDTGTYQFPLTAGAFAQSPPPLGVTLSRFTLTAVMPMEHVLEIASHCSEKRQYSGNYVKALLTTPAENGISYSLIEETTKRLEKVMTKYYGTGDYTITSLAMKKEMQESGDQAMYIIVSFLTGLLALIGLSNVWASISGNLRQRKKEFAMLRSTGLSPGQLRKMLFLEGIFLGLRPLVFSLPFQAVILAAFIWINEVTLGEYLPHAPAAAILGYTLLILLAVTAAYALGERRIRKENIIDALKDDTL